MIRDLLLRLFREPADLFDLGSIEAGRPRRTRDPLDLSAGGDGVPRRPCYDLTGREATGGMLLAMRERGRYPSLAEPDHWGDRGA